MVLKVMDVTPGISSHQQVFDRAVRLMALPLTVYVNDGDSTLLWPPGPDHSLINNIHGRGRRSDDG
jgi:hypothetical protein